MGLKMRLQLILAEMVHRSLATGTPIASAFLEGGVTYYVSYKQHVHHSTVHQWSVCTDPDPDTDAVAWMSLWTTIEE